MQLTLSAGLDHAVDLDEATLNRLLGIAAGVDEHCSFEKMIESKLGDVGGAHLSTIAVVACDRRPIRTIRSPAVRLVVANPGAELKDTGAATRGRATVDACDDDDDDDDDDGSAGMCSRVCLHKKSTGMHDTARPFSAPQAGPPLDVRRKKTGRTRDHRRGETKCQPASR